MQLPYGGFGMMAFDENDNTLQIFTAIGILECWASGIQPIYYDLQRSSRSHP